MFSLYSYILWMWSVYLSSSCWEYLGWFPCFTVTNDAQWETLHIHYFICVLEYWSHILTCQIAMSSDICTSNSDISKLLSREVVPFYNFTYNVWAAGLFWKQSLISRSKFLTFCTCKRSQQTQFTWWQLADPVVCIQLPGEYTEPIPMWQLWISSLSHHVALWLHQNGTWDVFFSLLPFSSVRWNLNLFGGDQIAIPSWVWLEYVGDEKTESAAGVLSMSPYSFFPRVFISLAHFLFQYISNWVGS